MRLLRHSAHFGVYIFGQAQNVIRIGAAQIVSLIEYFHSHAAVSSVLDVWLFCGRCHVCSPSVSSRPALLTCDRSAPAFSLLVRESLRALFASRPSRGAC